MRKRIVIIGVVVLVFCLWLLLRHKTEQHISALHESEVVLTNQPSSSQPIQPQAVKPAPDANAPKLSPAMMAEMVRRRTPEASNEIQERALTRWQAPINFYGKVVDENSNAVTGADITFGWSEFPTVEGAHRATTKSDTQGIFSLHDKRGPALDIWVGKEGYYASQGGQKGFSYMNGDFSPDSENPIVFFLRKKGQAEPLIKTDFPVGMGQIAQLRHDGTPVEIDLLKGEKVSAGSGQLKLEFWRDVSNNKANAFDWKLQLTVPGGGLVETSQEFAFEAPQNGYQPATVIDMPATNQNWRGEIRSKYYIQLPDGKYGRIDLYLLTFNGVFTVQSAVNPSGSRNLEPK